MNVTASVNATLSVAGQKATLDFGALDIGGTSGVVTNTATVKSNVANGYSFSIRRTAFSGGDIPMSVMFAAVPAGADLDVSPHLWNGIGLSNFVDGLRTGSAGPFTGDAWDGSYRLGPVAWTGAGAHTATITYTAVGHP